MDILFNTHEIYNTRSIKTAKLPNYREHKNKHYGIELWFTFARARFRTPNSGYQWYQLYLMQIVILYQIPLKAVHLCKRSQILYFIYRKQNENYISKFLVQTSYANNYSQYVFHKLIFNYRYWGTSCIRITEMKRILQRDWAKNSEPIVLVLNFMYRHYRNNRKTKKLYLQEKSEQFWIFWHKNIR